MPEMKTWTANGVQFTLPFAPAGYGLGEEVQTVSSIDNLLVPGQYKFYNGGYPLIAGVDETKFCDVEVISSGGGCIHRITTITGGYRAERMYNGTAWGEWKRCDPAAFAPAGYGLGGNGQPVTISSLADLDNIKANGTYAISSTTVLVVNNILIQNFTLEVFMYTVAYGHQIIRPLGYTGILVRKCENYVWGEFEWDNPPMYPGVEYRTTERWNGKAVYTMLIESGTLVSGGNVITFKELWPTEVIGIRITVGGAFNSPSIYGTLDSIYSVYHTVTKGVADIDITLFVGASHSGKNAKVQVWFVR